MKKLLGIILALALTLTLAVPVSAHSQNDPYVVDLIAGQHYDVGEVSVWNDGDNLHVEYSVDGAWYLTETHLSVKLDWEDIPQKNGNPIPGKFKFDDYLVSAGEYVIPLDDIPAESGTELYIAAHGVVEKDCDAALPSLPAQVCFTVATPAEGGAAYFPSVTVTGGTALDGTYVGWCIDTDHFITPGASYCNAAVYSSYESLPAGLIEYPENLDLVNWILNQDYVGQASPGCEGNYTFGDVQRAIWALVDDSQWDRHLYDWSQCRVDEILAAAYAGGEGYVPGYGENVWVVLVPAGAQPIIIPRGLECGEETAWAEGYDFPGSNWAMYFTYTVGE